MNRVKLCKREKYSRLPVLKTKLSYYKVFSHRPSLKQSSLQGSDCPYSHDILPPHKPELCKFFMKDCCAKDDKCLYMHSEFPCKYFHTGLKCYANKKCKFNHGVLTDTLHNILAKVRELYHLCFLDLM